MKPEPRPAIHVERQLGWARNLGGAESLGISKVSQTVLTRLIESQICHQLTGSVGGEGLEKEQWLLLALMPDTSVSLFMPLVPFKLLLQRWCSEGMSLSR